MLSSEEQRECLQMIRRSVLFRYASEEDLKMLVKLMKKQSYQHGQILSKEGEPQTKMFILAEGSVIREKCTEDGQIHHIDTHMGGQTVGSLHIMNKDPCYATSRCTSTLCRTYELDSDIFNKFFLSNPNFAWNVAYGLTMEIRHYTKLQRTPLLEQKGKKTPFIAVSVAAGMESFYRAAMNALINQRLTGKRSSLFPNMHIQLPTRIAYINGFKGIRQYLDKMVSPSLN